MAVARKIGVGRRVSAPYLDITQGDRKILLTKLPASVVTKISYAAVRGQSQEEGAVQRILNGDRIASIKKFTLEGGQYPNAIILNWVKSGDDLQTGGGKISFPAATLSAQIIDGQHRVAGISAAIEEDADFGKIELPVVFYKNLTTKECADLFLSINTEQKPVPRSLVFDLYGEASETVVDPAAVRARDIAMFLNERGSPYEDEIKLPGAAKRRGGIPLSSAVTAVKPLIDDKGAFEQVSITELEVQRKIIKNWFVALQEMYGDGWDDKTNVFQYASGFMAALDFLRLQLIPYCNINNSFEAKTMLAAMNLTPLILQSEVKGQGGAEAQKRIFERLKGAFAVKTSRSSARIKY